jgi:hypothetical protein
MHKVLLCGAILLLAAGCAKAAPKTAAATAAPVTAAPEVAAPEAGPGRGEVVFDENGKAYLRLSEGERLCAECDR